MKTPHILSAIALTALLGGGATYQATYAAPRPVRNLPEPTFVPSKPAPLSLTMVTDKAQYKRGETVTFIISVRNVSAKPQQLTFPNGQEYDVTASNRETNSGTTFKKVPSVVKWQWSWGFSRFFVAQVHTLKLAPGATRTWRATWDQRLEEGRSQLVKPGMHQAIAKLTLQKPIRSNVVDLKIVP